MGEMPKGQITEDVYINDEIMTVYSAFMCIYAILWMCRTNDQDSITMDECGHMDLHGLYSISSFLLRRSEEQEGAGYFGILTCSLLFLAPSSSKVSLSKFFA